MPELKKTMFREYDIRGRVSDDELNEKTAELIGKGFGTFLRKRNINKTVVGYDAREYSERLKNAFVKGVISTGVDVIDVGMTLSPILYFSQPQWLEWI
jgi:phosphomannomutase/phosphoglucomutase